MAYINMVNNEFINNQLLIYYRVVLKVKQTNCVGLHEIFINKAALVFLKINRRLYKIINVPQLSNKH